MFHSSSNENKESSRNGQNQSSDKVELEKDFQKYSKLFVFSGGNKAGMEAMDKEKQAEIIYEMSKNSAFLKRAMKLDEDANVKALKYQKKFAEVNHSSTLQQRLQAQINNKLLEYENKRNFQQICCVLDMDMFYAAVEIRDQPQLKDLPVAVGGDAMISTSNYVARKYGVRAAMPGFIAKKLCPHLVFVRCNFDKYQVVATQIREIIKEYDPSYSSHSLDEVYFDLTAIARQKYLEKHQQNLLAAMNCNEQTATAYGSNYTHTTNNMSIPIDKLRQEAFLLLQEIRQRIKDKTGGLTSSAGMANNFFLAKICADMNKPDGQYELLPSREKVIEFLTNLPTRKIGGIGKVMEKMLEKLEMKTVGDIRQYLSQILYAFTPISAEFLLRISIGIASEEGVEKLRIVTSSSASPAGAKTGGGQHQEGEEETGGSSNNVVVTRKSIGSERTYFAKGIEDPNELFQKLHEICCTVHEDMVQENLHGKTVTVKVKDINFNLHTRTQSITSYHIQSVESIEKIAKNILQSFFPIRIRLLGVSVSKFLNAYDEDQQEYGGSGNGKQQQLLSKFLVKGEKREIKSGGASNNLITIDCLDDDDDEVEEDDLKSRQSKDYNDNTGDDEITIQSTDYSNSSFQLHHDVEDENVEYYHNYNHHHPTSEKTDNNTNNTKKAFSFSSSSFSSSSAKSNALHHVSTSNNNMVSVSSLGSYECPVCNKVIEGDYIRFSLHVDHCLNPQHNKSITTTSNSTKKRKNQSVDSIQTSTNIATFFNKKR